MSNFVTAPRVSSIVALFVTLLIFGGCTHISPTISPTATTMPEVQYRVQRLDGTPESYRITIKFPGAASGKTHLYIPGEWASAKGADQGIRNLRTLSTGAKLVPNDHAALSSVVEYPPGAPVTLSYELVAIDPSPPHASAKTQYLPVLQPTYVHWIGYTTWVIPWISNSKRARLTFENFAPDWNVATSYGNGRELDFNWNPNAFAQSLVVAGDFRIVEKPIGSTNIKLTFAIRGNWPRDDESFAHRLAEIVDNQRQFWRDTRTDGYLVTLLPIVKDDGSSMSGTALLNSFTSLVTQNNTPERIEYVWIHESLHQWLPRAFGGLENPQAKLYWFSEGFTDYYTHVLMLRARQRTLGEFVDEINKTLQALSTSKHARLNNDAVASGFHTDPDIAKLAYQRGLLLAATWDNDIRGSSNGRHSLDDAMRWLLEVQRGNPGIPLNRARIEAMAKQYGVANPTEDVDSFMESGQPITARLSALLPCVVDDRLDPTLAQRFRVVNADACAAFIH